MKLAIRMIIFFSLSTLPACGPARMSNCEERGTIGSDRVPDPRQGFDISFQYYLPPCYTGIEPIRYPVIYLIAMPYESNLDPAATSPMSLADRLIRDRRMAPVILIVPNDTVGFGYHAALATDLIPYVDDNFNTLPDRGHRGVGGISHGAAIAARMAFQYPGLFGSLGVFSGGIDPGETGRFNDWIASASPENLPRVLIDVGNQDGILPLTESLLGVLDAQNVPYTLERGAGGHNWTYWSARMQSYLLWFGDASE